MTAIHAAKSTKPYLIPELPSRSLTFARPSGAAALGFRAGGFREPRILPKTIDPAKRGAVNPLKAGALH